MFKIDKKDVKFSSMNTRIEKHGAENVGAIDLKLTLECRNDTLEQFEKGLTARFYEKREDEEAKQDELDVSHAGFFPNLIQNFRHFKQQEYTEEYAGYRFRSMNPAADDDCDILLTDCTLKKFKFKLMEGGSIEIEFTLQAIPHSQDKHEVSYLFSRMGQNLLVDLQPPRAESIAGAQADVED